MLGPLFPSLFFRQAALSRLLLLSSGTVQVGKTRSAEADISYRIYGTGEEKLVLIMGFVTSSGAWFPTVEYFARKHSSAYSVLIFDNRYETCCLAPSPSS